MKPSKSKQYFESCQGGLVGKISISSLLKAKFDYLINRRLELGRMWVKQNEAVLEALYRIA